MNIHIEKNKFDFILENTIYYKFTIGSKLYGISDEKSDTDYLIVYHPFKNQLLNPFTNPHQLQYKDLENNIDYNLIDIITFIRNLVSGDSTINYEIINGEEIKNTDLSFLYENRNSFKTFNIAKAYLGFARRDVKHFFKRNSIEDMISGLLHIERSISIAKYIMYGDSSLESIYDNLAYMKIGYYSVIKSNSDFKTILDIYRLSIDDLRNKLTHLHNNENIIKYLSPDIQVLISDKLNDLVVMSDKKIKMDDFYFHNENIEFKY
jgi:predicted nucleotidyltransferase